MRPSFVVPLGLVAALLSACDPGDGSASAALPEPSPPGSLAASAPASPPPRIPLPRGFPVPPAAVPVAMPNDDPGLIGLWTNGVSGSGAYEFYRAALPAAGYSIVAAYPGGAAAVIRFRLPDGAIWQLVTRAGPGGSVAIEVRLDRP